MNTTDGLALFLVTILLFGSISFIYRWSLGSVSDAQGLFGVAGLAVSLVFPAFFVPDLYKEVFVTLRALLVVPAATVMAVPVLATGEASSQVATAAAVEAQKVANAAANGISGIVGSVVSTISGITSSIYNSVVGAASDAADGLEGGKRAKRRRA
jgi:predicted acyltransferase